MKKNAAIKALAIGLEEAINIIEHLTGQLKSLKVSEDPAIRHQVENLAQLLEYSEHVHDGSDGVKTHPVYDT